MFSAPNLDQIRQKSVNQQKPAQDDRHTGSKVVLPSPEWQKMQVVILSIHSVAYSHR